MPVKKIIQEMLLTPYRKKYKKACLRAQNSYDEFIKREEKKKSTVSNANCLSVEIRNYKDGFDLSSSEKDIVIFLSDEAVLSPFAQGLISAYFYEHPECVMIYADEDYVEGKKPEQQTVTRIPASKRLFPFMKPVPSKETILSWFYVGSMFAVLRKPAEEITPFQGTAFESAYSFVLKLWLKYKSERIGKISDVLSHVYLKDVSAAERLMRGCEKEFDALKEECFTEFDIRASLVPDEYGISHVVYDTSPEPKVSVLIPTKDHPDVLRRCIVSLREINDYQNIEIIVVDNGSEETARKETEQMSKTLHFTYVYEKQEFNYSHMNNLARTKADGEYLLLLNDDMEVKSSHAIKRMLSQAMQPGVGAVGAKLLYPDSSRIQHVGITNAVDGPVHKFITYDDNEIYHHGRNRLVSNCLGVTGACLMVKTEYYDDLCGLNEELKVAYNDVDFCFRLIEKGLVNVIRNDCILYHHESLSRGADVLSADKMERLSKERKLLYRAHPQFYRTDPYEGACISGGSELGFDMENCFERKKTKAECPRRTKKDYHKYPGGIHVVFDRLEKEEFLKSFGETFYVLQGFAVIPQIDNVRFTYRMIFEGETGSTYEMPMKGYLRMNLEGGFPETENIKMAGFCNFVTESELPKDTYRIGVFAIDHAARRRLYQDTGRTLTID
ncbi:MAG: glycosyltransferase [Lachnospiraceae bacterium]|nr:glycosyltransferase [Lachnospiraceae bacterium]